MDEFLKFFVDFKVQIYIILGVGVVISLGQVLRAVKEWQGAAFGLEKDVARGHFSPAMTRLLICFALTVVEFVLVSFVVPNRPKAIILATPTLDLLATPTATLIVGTKPVLTPTSFALTMPPVSAEGCDPNKINWTYPKNGGELKGVVELKVTVQVNNLGFFKYEYSKAGDNVWVTIAANNTQKKDEALGFWNTADLPQGDYRLRLVVADNQNQILPACVINIRIVSP